VAVAVRQEDSVGESIALHIAKYGISSPTRVGNVMLGKHIALQIRHAKQFMQRLRSDEVLHIHFGPCEIKGFVILSR
jgi:hypothetical protein